MGFKKSIFTCFVCTYAFLSIYSHTAYAKNIVSVDATNVNIRKEASTESEVLSQATFGDTMDVISLNGTWAKVNIPSIGEGFVTTEFLKVVEADGSIVENGVNIRSLPNIDSNIVAQADDRAVFSFKSINNDFYGFTYEGQDAYIHKDFVKGAMLDKLPVNKTVAVAAKAAEPSKSNNAYAVVTSEDGINFRTEANIDAEVITKLTNNEVLDVITVDSTWHKVSFNGKIGYVNSEFVEISYGDKPVRVASVNSLGSQIVNYGKQFLGTPYVWGGTNLKNGVDCSGFTYSVMKANGIELNRSSRDQVRNGSKVSKGDLSAGDLVFFGNGGANNISHVGIYIGGGDFIHASSSKNSYCVTISNLSEDYYVNNYISATRVIN